MLIFNSLTAKEGVDYPKGLRLLSRYTKNRLAICKKSNNLENIDELAHFLLNISYMEPDVGAKKDNSIFAGIAL